MSLLHQQRSKYVTAIYYRELQRERRPHSELTYAQAKAVDVLARSWIDLVALNYAGRKGIFELLEEVLRREAFLLPDTDGGVIRFAESLQLIIRFGNWWLRRHWRHYRPSEDEYPESKFFKRCRQIFFHVVVSSFVGKECLYGISETRIRWEDLDITAIMGLMEEARISITESELANLLIDKSPPKIDDHPSSAYAQIRSKVYVYRFLLTLEKPHWKLFFGKIVEDTRVEEYLKWRYSRKMPPGNWISREKWKSAGKRVLANFGELQHTLQQMLQEQGELSGEQVRLLLSLKSQPYP